MLTTESIVNALGGRKVLKRRVANLSDLRETVKAGLPYASFEVLSAKLGLARDEAAHALHLPHRTIARRKKQKKLRADESDRVLRLARIIAQATATLGSETKPWGGCAVPIEPSVMFRRSNCSTRTSGFDKLKIFLAASSTAS